MDMPLPGPPVTDMLLWICSFPLWICPARTSYDGYAPMDMLLPTVDMLRPGYAPMDMLLLNCGYASIRISHGGYAPMNTLLPPMDMLISATMMLLPESPHMGMTGGYDISKRKQHQDEL